LRKLQRDRHVLPEPLLPFGIAHEAAVAGRHVASVEVEERDLDASVPHSPLDLAEVLARRPPELNSREAGLRGPPEAFEQRDLFE